MSNCKGFENLFNIESNNVLQKLEEILTKEHIDFFKNYIKKRFSEIMQSLDKNENVFASELYFAIYGMRLIGKKITEEDVQKIFSFINSIKNSKGGFSPLNEISRFTKDDFQRINSTYYGLCILKEIDRLEEFKKNNKKWIKRTSEHISSEQNEEDGYFYDSVAEYSKNIENSYWALSILYFLDDDLTKIDIKKLTDKLKKYLDEKEIKSITRFFYFQLLRKCLNENLSDSEENKIKDFIKSVEKDGKYFEHSFNTKKKYRNDSTEAKTKSFIHSNIFARKILSEINGEVITNEFKKQLLEKFFDENGKFDNQLKIKNIDFGPRFTMFEIVLSLLFCLDESAKNDKK